MRNKNFRRFRGPRIGQETRPQSKNPWQNIHESRCINRMDYPAISFGTSSEEETEEELPFPSFANDGVAKSSDVLPTAAASSTPPFPDASHYLLYNFVGRQTDELTACTGDRIKLLSPNGIEDWSHCQLSNGATGLLPGNYLVEIKPDNKPELPPRRQQESIHRRTSRALYNYQPRNKDELDFVQGDLLLEQAHDHHKEDEWCVMLNTRTGKTGLVPENYVKFVVDQKDGVAAVAAAPTTAELAELAELAEPMTTTKILLTEPWPTPTESLPTPTLTPTPTPVPTPTLLAPIPLPVPTSFAVPSAPPPENDGNNGTTTTQRRPILSSNRSLPSSSASSSSSSSPSLSSSSPETKFGTRTVSKGLPFKYVPRFHN